MHEGGFTKGFEKSYFTKMVIQSKWLSSHVRILVTYCDIADYRS